MEISLSDEFLLTSAVALGMLALVVIVAVLVRKGTIFSAMERYQSELIGRLAQMSQYASLEQNKISQAIAEQKLSLLNMIDERLFQVTQNVGSGLQQSASKTNETLANLRERLAAIDAAQQKIASLSEQVVSLQEILSNKQARGAFGEIQLHDLIVSVLPASVYAFQCVLSNQNEPIALSDYLIRPAQSLLIQNFRLRVIKHSEKLKMPEKKLKPKDCSGLQY